MSFQLLDIVLYSHAGDRRVLPLKPGTISIITGDSKTGKSALVQIADYCFGSRDCEVPSGIIRNCTSWYGVRLQAGKQQAFVARRGPTDASSSSEVFWAVSKQLEIPQYDDLSATTNRETLTQLLGDFAGIGPHLHEPPEGQTRSPLAAGIRTALAFCFQPQDELIQRKYLFHGQSNNYVAQAIKDTLPYFLGAVDEDSLSKTRKLKQLQEKLKTRERSLNQLEAVAGSGLGKAATLVSEAMDLGLAPKAPAPESLQDAVKLLREIVDRPPTDDLPPEDEVGQEEQRLQNARSEMRMKLGDLRKKADALRLFLKDGEGFSSEVREHGARLQSLGLVEQESGENACPLCQQTTDTIPTVENLRDSLQETSRELESVSAHSPALQNSLDDIEQKISELQERLTDNRESLEALRRANDALAKLKDEMARRSYIVGRISLYLESLPEVADSSALRREIESLQASIEKLLSQVSAESVEEKLTSIMSRISVRLTEWAKTLDLEHSGFPFRFDPRKLTVVADTDEGAIPMESTGSGANWVGYHLVAHLALHHWFRTNDRPVPGFVFLDQPSQAYYPADPDDDGRGTNLADTDREAVTRLFRFVVDVVQDLAPELQIVIMEHADIAESWYQDLVVERWRGGRALIPDSWAQN